MRRIATTILAIATISAGPALAQKAEKPRQVLFTNVHVFDGINKSRIKNANVLVEGNLIKTVSTNPIKADGAYQVDGGGRTLMPGLTDMHTHLSSFLPLAHSKSSLHPYAHGALAALRAKEILMNGYTTVRDAGGAANYLRKLIDAGMLLGPRIYPSETWISSTSGHFDFRGLNEPHTSLNGVRHFYDQYVAIIADGPDEVTRAARETFRAGATQIKLATSGGITSEFDPLHTGPNAEEVRAAVKVAEAWDTYVLVHAFTENAIRLAIDNGAKSIEHAPFLTDKIAKVMIEKGIFLATSVGPVFEVDVETARKQYTAASFKKWKRVRDAAKNAMKVMAANKELKVVLGSDLLAPIDKLKETDDKMNLDFKYFGDAFGTIRTLKMATSLPAELNMMTGKMNPYTDGPLGVVKAGAYADLLLVDGNPLENILLLTDPDANLKIIMKDGVIHKNSLN